MELHSVFITGANRGIGLEFVRQFVQLSKPPTFIFATYRSRDGVQALEEIREKFKTTTQVLPIKMDITKKNEIEAARNIVEGMVGNKGLTLLINNAGVSAPQQFPKLTEENLLYHFQTNTVAPTIVIQEFLPLLKKAANVRDQDFKTKMSVNRASILNISAEVGSITRMTNADWIAPGYSISKAALNMATRIIAAKVKDDGILVVSVCPGWVKTDMGSQIAPLEVQESVSAIFNTLTTLDESHHGHFMDRFGKLFEF